MMSIRSEEKPVENIGASELIIVVFVLLLPVLIVLWLIGVIKLFQKNQTTLGWIAVAGIIVPFIGFVAYAGYFVEDRSGQT